MRKEIPVETLRALYEYDPETGAFYWRESTKYQPDRAGKRADHWSRGQYRHVYPMRGMCLFAHRAAFAYVHGRWPDGQIDHINRDPGDNRIANLRDVTPSDNNLNRNRCTRTWRKSRPLTLS